MPEALDKSPGTFYTFKCKGCGRPFIKARDLDKLLEALPEGKCRRCSKYTYATESSLRGSPKLLLSDVPIR